MDVVIERCASLDVHKASVTACVRFPGGAGRLQEIRTFRTTSAGLAQLHDWLASFGVTVVAMESSGVYWKPVYYMLEGTFECQLLNAEHIKQVPGRKTDVKDAEWIAQLVEHGLVRPSFVPPKPIRELRDITRYRKSLTYERTREVQRLNKMLEDAGIKLSSVASNVMGASGKAMINALVSGTHDPEVLADLAQGKLRAKLPELREALKGHFDPHHAFIVSRIMAHIDYLDESIEELSSEIERLMSPLSRKLDLLKTIPGVGQRTAEVIMAETGGDMSRFLTHRHLASWAGLCPGNHRSAGKSRTAKTRKGSKWLKAALVEAASAAARSKGSYFSAQYSRLKAKRGPSKARIAVAHSILVTAYYVLLREAAYEDLGSDYFLDRESSTALTNRLVRQLERLGHSVELAPLEAVV